MKKKFFFLFFIPIFIGNSFSQNPLVKMWDYRYGSSASEMLSCFIQTGDGGFILGGHSNSGISGDKTQPVWGSNDFWIVKTDRYGVKQWDKDFGALNFEMTRAACQADDGGYLFGGYSNSGIGGDKTQPAWGGVYGDFWILKTDSLGNKLWDRSYGGMSEDYLYAIAPTPDRGFILGGYSCSAVGGDKSQNAWAGTYDYWIVKIDSAGNKQWDRRFGGYDTDVLLKIKVSNDGGFVLGGYSLSTAGGDKTQVAFGMQDYWIVKTDSLGNKQWDQSFGGNSYDYFSALEATTDGGFLLGGFSNSGISGNKTSGSWGLSDFWILKIDSLGNKLWEKNFGGSDTEDEFGSIVLTSDGGLLLAGTSYSNVSGIKTENNLGTEQTWVVKTDLSGTVLWDQTIFTTGHDEYSYAVETSDGCYAIANLTNAGQGGYKSQSNRDSTLVSNDFWIVKFCDSTSFLPVAAAVPPQALCPGTCSDFINLSLNATSYQWLLPWRYTRHQHSNKPGKHLLSTFRHL